MEKQFKDFYDTLIENLDSYNGDYASFIDCGPRLFKLLTDILDYEEVNKELRLLIGAAITYYVVPTDVIPEQIYGPYGYIDDIYVSVYVLREVASKLGYNFLQRAWENDGNIKDIMDDCFEKSEDVLKEQIDEILGYVGLI